MLLGLGGLPYQRGGLQIQSADLGLFCRAQYLMATKGGVITKEGVPPAAILQILQLQGIRLNCEWRNCSLPPNSPMLTREPHRRQVPDSHQGLHYRRMDRLALDPHLVSFAHLPHPARARR